MKALRSLLFAFLTVTTISLSCQKEYLLPDVEVCRLFKDGTKLRKPGTCDREIICQNFVSTPGVQCAKWYSIESSACTTKKPSDYCTTSCKSAKTLFIADKKNCNDWIQCNNNKEVSAGTCPAGQEFSVKQQSCIYNSGCVATYDICDVTPAGISFQDENNCHQYYQCVKKKATSFTCETGKYYDRGTGVCIAKAQADCYKHPTPANVCGNEKLSISGKFVSDQATCRGYFYCKNLGVGVPDKAPSWGQCSSFEFFNEKEQACQLRSHVPCNEDRCDGRRMGEMEISGRKGCQHYLICGDNYTLGEHYCGDGLYFNAEEGICTPIRKPYPACT